MAAQRQRGNTEVERVADLAVCGYFDIVSMALTWPAFYGNSAKVEHVWQVISYDQQSAREYYASLDVETRTGEAAEALVLAGWTRASICFRMS